MLRRSVHRTPWALVLILSLTILLACLFSTMTVFGQGEAGDARQYIVYAVYNESQRMEIAGTGAIIDFVGNDWIEVWATPEEVSAIEALGYKVEVLVTRSEGAALEVYLPLITSSGRMDSGEEEEIGIAPQYIVYGVYDRHQRSEIARNGAAIDAAGSDWVEISAIPEEIAAIEALGYQVEPLSPPPRSPGVPAL